MTYKVATGWNVALGSLVAIDPQPHSIGPQTTRRTVAISGAVTQELGHIRLLWDVVEDADQLAAIYAYFGLSLSVFTSAVTILIPDQMYDDQRVNGTAVRPLIGRDVTRDRYFLRDLSILVKGLVTAT